MWKALWIIVALSLTSVLCESNADEDATVEADPTENIDVNMPGMNGKLPSPAELLKMLDSMDISEEEKDNIRESILKNAESVDSIVGPTSGGFLYQTLILLSFLSVLALIFGFFGYKLYKSLIEKDIKREMKRKQKELKKKK